MPADINCPFCNAVIPMSEPSARLICPRCSEPLSPGSTESPATRPSLNEEISRHRQARLASPTNKAALGVGLMAVFLSIGVALWFWQRNSPNNDIPADPLNLYAPADLPALRYLPQGADSVIALRLQPLLGLEPAASNAEIETTLATFGLPAESMTSLEKNWGITWDQLDQIVLGAQLKNGLEPDKMVAVLQLRRPISEDVLSSKFTLEHDRKTNRRIYRSRGFPTIYCWFVQPQFIVAALSVEMLHDPGLPFAGLDHLNPVLAERIRNELPRAPIAWAIIDSEKFASIAGLAATLRPELREWQEPVSKIRSVVIAATPTDAKPSIGVHIHLQSEQFAEQWQKTIKQRFAAYPQIQVGRDGSTVMLGFSTDAKTLAILTGKE